MPRQIRVSQIYRRNSKSRSRSTMPSQHHARRVSKAFPHKLARRLRDPLSITAVRDVRVATDVRVVIANPEPSKPLRKSRKIVMKALSKLTVKRDVVAKEEEAVAEAEVAVVASIREKTSMSTEAHARMMHLRLPLRKPLPSLFSKRRKRLLRLLSLTRTSGAGVKILSSDGPINLYNFHDNHKLASN